MAKRETFYENQKVGECFFVSDNSPEIDTKGVLRRVATFKCFCGNFFSCRVDAVKSNGNGCGCKKFDAIHGHSRSGVQTKEYQTWARMKDRCGNTESKSFYRYGGRGIRVCDRWLNSFENFILDMGLIPENGLSLDRIDNNGNYEKSNCRWATSKQQARNRRTNRIIEFNGESLCLSQWAERMDIPQSKLWKWVTLYGWTMPKCFQRSKTENTLV